MSAWKEWMLTGSEESYREFCDECRRDELMDLYEYDDYEDEEEYEDEDN